MQNTVVRALVVCALATALCAIGLQAQHPAPAADPARPAAPADVAAALRKGYPESYDRMGAGGPVHVRIFIHADGRADSLQVTSSTGYDALDAVALGALRPAKYLPAREGGRPVPSWLELPLQFPSAIPTPSVAVLNREAVVAAAQRLHPADLKDGRITVAVPLQLEIDGEGRVTSQQSPEQVCMPEAAHVAHDLASRLRFERAAASSGPRHVAMTVLFDDSVSIVVRGDRRPLEESFVHGDGSRSRNSRRPELSNRDAVRNAMVLNYPQHLKSQGRGGTAILDVHVDEEGRVLRRRIGAHSGHCELDLAALRVAASMRFRPALSGGRPQAAWVRVPVVFTSR